MAPRSAAGLMDLWDALVRCAPGGREAILVRHCLGNDATPPGAAISLGERQAAILAGFAAAFGSRLACVDDCPACETRLVAEISVDDLLAAQAAAPASSGRLVEGDWQVDYRLPTAEDLTAAAAAADPAGAAARLKSATIQALTQGGRATEIDALPEALVAALAERIEIEDPLAVAEIALSCPDCGHRWVSGLDAARIFDARLDAWARRTLWEVHQLAMRYGWREDDLLAMSPQRREAYLLMDAP